MTDVINIQRVDAQEGNSAVLNELRDKLSPRGDIVSPRGKALTEEVFGEPLSPIEVVERICSDVQSDGSAALLRYTAALDKASLSEDQLRVSEEELVDAPKDTVQFSQLPEAPEGAEIAGVDVVIRLRKSK